MACLFLIRFCELDYTLSRNATGFIPVAFAIQMIDYVAEIAELVGKLSAVSPLFC